MANLETRNFASRRQLLQVREPFQQSPLSGNPKVCEGGNPPGNFSPPTAPPDQPIGSNFASLHGVPRQHSLKCLKLDEWNTQQAQLEVLRQKIPRLVWESAGICRVQCEMDQAIATLESWQKDFAAMPVSQFLLSLGPTEVASFDVPNVELHLRLWAETRNLLDIAYLILKSAAFRTESRGGHYRLDYPQPDPNWQVHTLVQKHNWWKSPVLEN
ncbi:MAG: hypothetical protein DSM106950_27370 [Stigonema ocellatum SAG 48.90 = DSM 106950]|nr:hypothetical protein [Stigonema ocellatum SAG 48.90 = DSM 106950]